MKNKIIPLILTLFLLPSCGKSKGTSYYHPELDNQYIEISEEEFASKLAANYKVPKDQYEFFRLDYHQDGGLDVYNSWMGDSSTTYYSFINTYGYSEYYQARPIVDIDGFVLGTHSLYGINMMAQRAFELVKDGQLDIDDSPLYQMTYYESPFAIKSEYHNPDTGAIETFSITYDDNFLPINAGYTYGNNPTREYTYSYFSRKNIKKNKGDINVYQYAERALDLYQNKITYTEYDVHIKGRTYFWTQPDEDHFEDVECTDSGVIKTSIPYSDEDYREQINKDRLLYYLEFEQYHNYQFVINPFEKYFKEDKSNDIMWSQDIGDSFTRIKQPSYRNYYETIYNDSPLSMTTYYDYDETYDKYLEHVYCEYNDKGLLTYCNYVSDVDPNVEGDGVDLEFTYTYR